MENAKPTPTPLPMSIRLSDKDSPSTDKERELNGKIPYASVVGSIMYAMVATRPNVTYVVVADIRVCVLDPGMTTEVLN